MHGEFHTTKVIVFAEGIVKERFCDLVHASAHRTAAHAVGAQSRSQPLEDFISCCSGDIASDKQLWMERFSIIPSIIRSSGNAPLRFLAQPIVPVHLSQKGASSWDKFRRFLFLLVMILSLSGIDWIAHGCFQLKSRSVEDWWYKSQSSGDYYTQWWMPSTWQLMQLKVNADSPNRLTTRTRQHLQEGGVAAQPGMVYPEG